MTLTAFSHVALSADAPIPYPPGHTRSVLDTVRTIALIGISAKENRPSYHVMEFLQHRGFTVYPVNPGLAGQTILGETVYPDLSAIPGPVDMAEIFRNSAAAASLTDDIIRLNAARPAESRIRVIWMQLGVRDDPAATRAEASGLTVIMDRCPKIELERG